MKPKNSMGDGKSVAFGGKGPGIRSFNQGSPQPGASAWKGKHQGGGPQNTKATKPC